MATNIDKFVTDPEHMVTDHTGLPGVGGAGSTLEAVLIAGNTTGDNSIVLTASSGAVRRIIGANDSVTLTIRAGDAAAASGNTGAQLVLRAGDGDGVGLGGLVSITGGSAGGGGGAGGAVTIVGGLATGGGNGGDVSMQAGTGTGDDGGNASISGGDDLTTGSAGGNVTIQGGTGGTGGGTGGSVSIDGGQCINGDGGGITIAAAPGVGTNRDGGSVIIRTGLGTGSGDGGNIEFYLGNAANPVWLIDENAGDLEAFDPATGDRYVRIEPDDGSIRLGRNQKLGGEGDVAFGNDGSVSGLATGLFMWDASAQQVEIRDDNDNCMIELDGNNNEIALYHSSGIRGMTINTTPGFSGEIKMEDAVDRAGTDTVMDLTIRGGNSEGTENGGSLTIRSGRANGSGTDGQLTVGAVGDLIGFYGITGQLQPNVTGARNNPEAALANLLNALASFGLIANNTTAS